MTVEGMSQSADRMVNNIIIMAIARASMVLALPTIAALFWLYTGWQDEKFDKIKAQVSVAETAATGASRKATDVSLRLAVVETKQENAADAGEKFQTEMLNRMDRMQNAIIELSNSVSALTATVQALAENQRSSRRGSHYQPP